MASSPYRRATQIIGPALGLLIGLAGLALSGAPTLALLLGVGGTLVEWMHSALGQPGDARRRSQQAALLALGAADRRHHAGRFAAEFWTGPVALAHSAARHATASRPGMTGKAWAACCCGLPGRPGPWPCGRCGAGAGSWPAAMWRCRCGLPAWRWPRRSPPTASDRSLLLSLPPLAALAAFALPTLKRSVASLIDWFTLLFFTGCAHHHLGHLDCHADRRSTAARRQCGQAGAGVRAQFFADRLCSGGRCHAGLGLAGALAHGRAPRSHLEIAGAARGRRHACAGCC